MNTMSCAYRYLRNEETKDSKVTKYIGNVTKSTEITFEYGVKKKTKKPKQKTGNIHVHLWFASKQ